MNVLRTGTHVMPMHDPAFAEPPPRGTRATRVLKSEVPREVLAEHFESYLCWCQPVQKYPDVWVHKGPDEILH